MRLAMKMRPKADQAQKASSQLLQKLPIHLRELVACVCVHIHWPCLNHWCAWHRKWLHIWALAF